MACNNIYQQFVHTRKEEFSQLPIVNPVSYFLSMLGTINKRRFSSIEITTIGQSWWWWIPTWKNSYWVLSPESIHKCNINWNSELQEKHFTLGQCKTCFWKSKAAMFDNEPCMSRKYDLPGCAVCMLALMQTCTKKKIMELLNQRITFEGTDTCNIWQWMWFVVMQMPWIKWKACVPMKFGKILHCTNQSKQNGGSWKRAYIWLRMDCQFFFLSSMLVSLHSSQ